MNLRKFTTFAFLSFLFLGLVFSSCRRQIATLNSWCLALTGEITIKQQDQGNADNYVFIQDRARLKKLKNKKPPKNRSAKKKVKPKVVKPKIDFLNPVVLNLPKTPQPQILFLDVEPKPGKHRLQAFPVLRVYNGKDFNKERTLVRAAVYKNKLYLYISCFDKEPDKIVTKYTETKGQKQAFRDDGVEIFIMNEPYPDGENYLHLVCSASGTNVPRFYENNNDTPIDKGPVEISGDYDVPLVDVKKTNNGFHIKMVLDLRVVGIEDLKPGDKFCMQIVRNYRGQTDKNSIILQLFPNYIYGDKRMRVNNHDRRCFNEVLVVKEDKK